MPKQIESSPTRLKPALVGKKAANVEPHSIPPVESDYEPPQPSGGPAISTPKEAPRDNPSSSPTASQTTATITEAEPKMCDTRIVGGEKQIYILGFGWIEDSDKPSIGIIVDGEGDINKMVGTMG